MNYEFIHETDSGFIKIPLLNRTEIFDVQNIVLEKANKASILKNNKFNDFHDLLKNYNWHMHQSLSSKEMRIFDSEEASRFLSLAGINRLIKSFPNYEIGEVVYGDLQYESRPEVYFRVVRPGSADDIGPLHCDKWFDSLYGLKRKIPSYKVWLSVYTEPSLNGLLIVPGSNKINWEYDAIETVSGPRPKPKFGTLEPVGHLIPIEPGEAIIFPDSTLHGGAINNGLYPRLSIEITFRSVSVE